MPARDGTGPMGIGKGIGRHSGCGRSVGRGLRLRDGSCRYLANEKDALLAEKRLLEGKLKLINQKLDSKSDQAEDQSEA